MSHPRFLTLAVPAAAAALLFAGGALAAGHGGGGHGGGGHAGGGHASFAHVGGVSHVGAMHVGGVSHVGVTHIGGFSHTGNFHNGNFHDGHFHDGHFHDGHFHNGFFGVGIGIGPWWGGYGGYPYYDYGYGYAYGAAPYDYGYGYTAPAVINNYNLDYTTPNYGTPSGGLMPPADNASQQQASDPTAHIEVRVPADAEVWFGTGKTSQTGTRREFVSPPLEPGKGFTYEIRARWVENGKEVTQTRRLDVSAGAWKGVDFTRPPVEAVEPPKPVKP
jgi:uncharacterized protein (TIGR03000 family)